LFVYLGEKWRRGGRKRERGREREKKKSPFVKGGGGWVFEV
jgi:hypothetical protein